MNVDKLNNEINERKEMKQELEELQRLGTCEGCGESVYDYEDYHSIPEGDFECPSLTSKRSIYVHKNPYCEKEAGI